MNKTTFLKFLKRVFNLQGMRNFLSGFWEKYSRIVFMMFSLLILSLGIYFWYQYTYKAEWSNDQKNRYKNSQNKEIDLNENQFKKVIEEVDRRKSLYQESVQKPKDIFAPYTGDQKEATNQNIDNSAPIESSSSIAPILPR
jgi:hypothetical protein